uniref:SHSP domain-containing protein n=1 Tax=Cyclopterus lumpus TaxID=8103 RepID=A0A8C2X8X8_CYCLU
MLRHETNIMLCSHGVQSALSPLGFSRPVRSLWPEVKPLLQQQDLVLELMGKLHHGILGKGEGEHFEVVYYKEELSVRHEGRKLRVSGKTERQDFRREFNLPEGPNPEAVICYLAPDGKLHIQAAKAPSEHILPGPDSSSGVSPPISSSSPSRVNKMFFVVYFVLLHLLKYV